MEISRRQNLDYGTGKISSVFSAVFFPTLFGMLFSVLFAATDGMFVSRGIGSSALAAVNLILPMFMLSSGIGMMFASGIAVTSAIRLARNDGKGAGRMVGQTLILTSAAGLLLGAVMFFFSDRILRLLGVSSTLLPLCREYYIWFIPSLLFSMIQMVGQFVARTDGSPKFSMYIEIIPAAVNIILDYVFIFPLRMGMVGAALATDLGTFVGVLMTAHYLLFRRNSIRLAHIGLPRTFFRESWETVKVGTAGLLSNAAIAILMVTGNTMFGKLIGDEGVAAFGVACYMMPIVFMVFAAISQTAQPILSFNYGAGEKGRVRKTLRLALRSSILFGCVMALFFWLFTSQAALIFLSPNDPAYPICTHGFPLLAAGFPLMALSIVCIGYFQSVEKSGAAIVTAILKGLVFPIGAFILLPKLIDADGLWLAVPVSDVLTLGVILIAATCGAFRLEEKK